MELQVVHAVHQDEVEVDHGHIEVRQGSLMIRLSSGTKSPFMSTMA